VNPVVYNNSNNSNNNNCAKNNILAPVFTVFSSFHIRNVIRLFLLTCNSFSYFQKIFFVIFIFKTRLSHVFPFIPNATHLPIRPKRDLFVEVVISLYFHPVFTYSHPFHNLLSSFMFLSNSSVYV
jgi:hypothetical protein